MLTFLTGRTQDFLSQNAIIDKELVCSGVLRRAPPKVLPFGGFGPPHYLLRTTAILGRQLVLRVFAPCARSTYYIWIWSTSGGYPRDGARVLRFRKMCSVTLHMALVCSGCTPRSTLILQNSLGAPGVTFGVYNIIRVKRKCQSTGGAPAHIEYYTGVFFPIFPEICCLGQAACSHFL